MTTDANFNPSKAFFIKLGEGGKYEKECIEENQTVRLGFNEAPHDPCKNGDWDVVGKELRKAGYKKINDTIRQIRCFYESGENVLWITFYDERLWWCFARQVVQHHPDHSRTRQVIGEWHSTNLIGETLHSSRLSGKLLQIKRYSGTICNVNEFDYLIRKIKGETGKDVAAAKKALLELESNLVAIIQNLAPKDFEILIDLIFRQTGLQRESVLGKDLKTLDLVISSPLTTKKYGVQVKTKASLADFEEYKAKFESMRDFDCFYFAVHTPDARLEQLQDNERIKLLLPQQIARLTVKYGLVDWVIDKAG